MSLHRVNSKYNNVSSAKLERSRLTSFTLITHFLIFVSGGNQHFAMEKKRAREATTQESNGSFYSSCIHCTLL